MAIRIVTVSEGKELKKLCEKHDELFEMEIGKANQDYICDNTGKEIPEDTECAVVLLLPNRNHENYQYQKSMLRNYIY